jgi:hypothetical protein
MKMKALVTSLILVASPSVADDAATWLCLFENLPITVELQSDVAAMPIASFQNGLGFPVSSIAVDLQIASSDLGVVVEESTVVPFPAHLRPGENRSTQLWVTQNDQMRQVLAAPDVTIRAAAANVLDADERRMVLRENIGPSFRVFWPSQPQSSQVCD